MKEDFMKNLKTAKKIKIDLENGIILDLKWRDDIKAYQGYSPEIDVEVGIWKPKTLYQIATEPGWGCKLILED